jgi:hypothetical protein
VDETLRNCLFVEDNVAEPWTGCFVPDVHNRREFCRLQSHGAGSEHQVLPLLQNYCCVVYRFVMSAYSIYYATKFGLEHPLANQYPYSQLLAREK